MLVKGHGTKLSSHGEKVLAALLQYPTVSEAASATGIASSTIFRWLNREDFQQRYREAQRAVFDGALLLMQAATLEAVATLRKNLKSKNPFASNSAAATILTHSRRARELDELQEKVTKLEKMLESLQKRRLRS